MSNYKGLDLLVFDDDEDVIPTVMNYSVKPKFRSLDLHSNPDSLFGAADKKAYGVILLDKAYGDNRDFGFELAGRIRSSSRRNSKTPIVVYTADTISRLQSIGKSNGVDALVQKPPTPNILNHVLGELGLGNVPDRKVYGSGAIIL